MNKWIAIFATAVGITAVTSTTSLHAQEAKVSFIFNGERIKIDRENGQAARFAATFASTGETCGAACIAPMQVAEGVMTFDEVQVLAFLVDVVADNQGLMVDARGPADRARGFIPGSVSLPHSTLGAENGYRADILSALGARELDGALNFADVRTLLVYDTGPSSNDAGLLVQSLLAVGYPTDKIKYYRGGMQVWSVLGFNVAEGGS